MTHEHNIIDSDRAFIIDPAKRSIENPSGKITLIQYDHNSERFGFTLPRFVEGHDMTETTSIQIHYINVGSNSESNSGVYAVNDAAVDPEDDNMMKFSWLVSSNCTQLVGSLSFAVRFSCVKNGVTEYSWGTSAFSGMTVSTSILNTETVVQEHADIIAAWEARISEIEKSNGLPSGGTEGQVLTADAEGNAVWADIEIPEPVTSWNDLEDRPFGSMIEEVVITENATATYAEYSGDGRPTALFGYSQGYPSGIYIKTGETYLVEWDGQSYTCVAVAGAYGAAIGNMSLKAGAKSELAGFQSVSEVDTGEPFAIFFVSYTETYSRAYASTAGEHTFTVKHSNEVIVQVDEKYLPIGKKGTGEYAEIFNDYEENIASGKYSHAEGNYTDAIGSSSHAEGYSTTASGTNSHAEGERTIASGQNSHAEGYYATAKGMSSHAEGSNTTASDNFSHAEGYYTIAKTESIHVQGKYNDASGAFGIEGVSETRSLGSSSSSNAFYLINEYELDADNGYYTIIDYDSTVKKYNELVVGAIYAQSNPSTVKKPNYIYRIDSITTNKTYLTNLKVVPKYAHIVGNGSSAAKRSNAHTLDWSGTAWFAGTIKLGGTGQDDETATEVATKDYVEERLSSIDIPDMSAYLSKEEASQLYQPLNSDDGVLTMVVESGLIDPVSSNTGELYTTSNDEVFVL